MSVEELHLEVRRARRDVERKVGEARTVVVAGKRLEAEVSELKSKVELYERAAQVLTSVGEQRQARAQEQIEALVTRGLQTIFSEDLSFHVLQSVTGKGRQPVVDFVIRSTLASGEVVETPVMEGRGGGMAATVGFLLRLVVLLLSRQQSSVLFLDETFGNLSAEFEPRLAEFLRELVDRTGVQVVMVTHSDSYSDLADKRYRFELQGGVTVASEV